MRAADFKSAASAIPPWERLHSLAEDGLLRGSFCGMEWLPLILLAASGLVAGAPRNSEVVSPFVRHCARCHGADGGGRGPKGERLPGGRISELGRLTTKDEAGLIGLILEGRKGMPGFKAKLEPEEARKLAVQVLKGASRNR